MLIGTSENDEASDINTLSDSDDMATHQYRPGCPFYTFDFRPPTGSKTFICKGSEGGEEGKMDDKRSKGCRKGELERKRWREGERGERAV